MAGLIKRTDFPDIIDLSLTNIIFGGSIIATGDGFADILIKPKNPDAGQVVLQRDGLLIALLSGRSPGSVLRSDRMQILSALLWELA